MKNTDPVEVQIEELHPDGYGIARNNLGVFGALPGETVMARPFTRRRKRVFARTESIAVPASDRVAPVCSAADVCGGCSLQHMNACAQIRFKQDQLMKLLRDNEPSEVIRPLRGSVRSYRRKARLGAKYVAGKERVLVGFREKMAPYVALIDRCEVLAEPVGSLVPALGEVIGELSRPSDIPQIEVAAGDGDAALVLRHLAPLTAADVGRLKQFAGRHRIRLYLQPGDPSTTHMIYPEKGEELLHYALPEFGLKLAFHPLDFIQVNAEINRKMVNEVVSHLALSGGDTVVDAFCGIGNFSLAAARTACRVYGFEGAAESVARARRNAAINGVSNCVFEQADLYAECLDIPALQNAGKVVIDPPRSGAEGLVKKLASHKVERVVYVSCNPRTLARDAGLLTDNGYRFEKAGVIDMFPHTTHIESIAVFSRTR